MSIGQLDSGGGGTDPYKGTGDECRSDARVHVEGRQVPYCNDGVETHVRKEGPAAITRETTVQLPIVWGERVVADAVNGLSGETPKRQQVAVELLDPFEDAYVPIHHGYISAAGGHPDRGTARFRVSDFSHLLGEIPASVTFEESATVRTVLDWVRDQLLDGQEVIDDLGMYEVAADDSLLFTSEGFVDIDEKLDEIVPPNPATETALPTTGGIQIGAVEAFFSDTVSFSADRDTLTDVLDWLCNRLDARWYFLPQPPEEPPRLVVEKNPTSASFHDTDHVSPSTESRPVKILENNALYQLNPVHKLKARGRSPSLTENIRNLPDATKDFPVVTVEYEPLAAQTEDDYPANEIEVDASVHDDIESIARNELKDRLDGAAGGEMRLAPSPLLRPYAKVDAVPVCGSTALTDLPPVAYEAEEVIHYATTAHKDTDPPSPRTVVRCGLFVDESKIVVVDGSKQTKEA